MATKYMVKIVINKRFDHYTGGRDTYNTLLTKLSYNSFDPFKECWMHRVISRK